MGAFFRLHIKSAICMLAITSLLVIPALSKSSVTIPLSAVTDSVEKDCDAYGDTVDWGSTDMVRAVKNRISPEYPYTNQIVPYACLWYQFDVTLEGRPENIRLVFKAPRDLGPEFERAAENAIQQWRYEFEVTPHQSLIRDVVARIGFANSIVESD